MTFTVNNWETIADEYKSAKTQLIRDKLIMEIFTAIYFNLEKMGVIIRDEDKRNDFILEFYGKIPGTFKTFNPALSSFKTYLITKLKFSAMNFIKDLQTYSLKEEIVASEELNRINSVTEDLENSGRYSFYTNEPEIPYKKDCCMKLGKKVFQWSSYGNMPIEHRRIFLLACKSCLFLDDAMIKKIAEKLNMPFQSLFDIINTLRNECEHRREKLDALICKRNKYYIKAKMYENLLKVNEENRSVYAKNKKSYSANCRFFYQAQQMSKKQIKTPSNAVIGKYLHLNRGTIDKNLYASFKKWDNGEILKQR